MHIRIQSMEDLVTASEFFRNAKRVLILSHRSPDGDTIGANLALRLALETFGKTVTSACIDHLPKMYRTFPEASLFVTDFDEYSYDLFVNVDASSVDQLQFPLKKKVFVGRKNSFREHRPPYFEYAFRHSQYR